MKMIQKLIALTALITMPFSSSYSQEIYCPPECEMPLEYCYEDPCAFDDSCGITQSSTLIPLGIFVVAGVVIAATTHHHDHHGHRRSCNSSHAHHN